MSPELVIIIIYDVLLLSVATANVTRCCSQAEVWRVYQVLSDFVGVTLHGSRTPFFVHLREFIKH